MDQKLSAASSLIIIIIISILIGLTCLGLLKSTRRTLVVIFTSFCPLLGLAVKVPQGGLPQHSRGETVNLNQEILSLAVTILLQWGEILKFYS